MVVTTHWHPNADSTTKTLTATVNAGESGAHPEKYKQKWTCTVTSSSVTMYAQNTGTASNDTYIKFEIYNSSGIIATFEAKGQSSKGVGASINQTYTHSSMDWKSY